MSAAALLKSKKNPSDAQIDQAMSGNICRCGCYTRIRASIRQVAEKRGAA
jgi:isoquinoline 1-oxidoreductase alpha subunit